MKVKNKLQANLIFAMVNMAVQVLQSMWITSYIQRTMGVEAYGYIAVVVNIVQAAGIVSVAFTSVCSRYIVIEMEKGDREKTNRIFSTMFYSLIALSILCVGVFGILILNISKVMNVSQAYIAQVSWLMLIVTIDFAIQLIQVPYLSMYYYEEKIYLSYLTQISANLVKVAMVYIIFNVWRPVLWASHMGAFVVNLGAVILYHLYMRRKFGYITPRIQNFDLEKLKEILGTGIWVSVNKLAAIMMTLCGTYMVNKLLGTYLAGIYGSVTQIQSMLSFITVAVVSVFLPEMYKKYAQNAMPALVSYTRNIIRMTSMFLGIIAGGVVICGNEFMSLWISEEYKSFGVLIIISTVYLPLIYSSEMLNQLLITLSRTKEIAILSIVTGIANLILAIVLVKYTTLGIYAISLAQAIVSIIRTLFVMPIYVAKIVRQKWYIFLAKQLSGWKTIVLASVCGMLYCRFIEVESWFTLIVVCALIALTTAGIMILIDREIRDFFKTVVWKKTVVQNKIENQ